MTEKPTLSLCMIVKDEADFLKSCLDSVNSAVDEIIIVDTGSKDDTIKIAKSFGAKVIKSEWKNDFSEARNVSLKHATKDWILVLDADEKISASDLKEIKILIENDDADAYSLTNRNYFKGRKPTGFEISSKNDTYSESKDYDGWFPSKFVILFKNNKGYEYTHMIHELVEASIKISGGNIVESNIPVHHFSVDRGEEADAIKSEKYYEICKKQIKSEPNNPKYNYELGVLYLKDKEYEKAIKFFEKTLQLIEASKDASQYNYTKSYATYELGFAYLKTKQYEKSANCFKEAIKQNPNSFVNYFFLAQANTMLNKIDEAVETYKKALQLNPNDEEIHNNLANLYLKSGKLDYAIQEFKIALKLSPNNPIIHRNLGATYIGLNKPTIAYEYLKKAVELNPEFEKDLRELLNQLESTKGKAIDKPTLSLCMIVKDEADFLKSCLDSVKSAVDEIIIVDTGSKDYTIKIAKSFGAKVIGYKWNDNFSDARNVSLKHATKDWILVLDADEKISASDFKEIKELILDDNVSAYSLIQRNYFKNRKPTSIEVSSKEDKYSESKSYEGWFPSRLVRLFRNNQDYEFTGIIHELVEQSIEIKKDIIVSTQIPIHHFRIEKDQEIDYNKRQKYLEMGLKQIETTPKNPKPYYEVGQIYLSEEKYEKAIELFEKAVEIVKIAKFPKKYKGVYVYICLSLGKCYIKTGKYGKSISFLKQFLNVVPDAPVVHFFMGQAYSELGKINDAVKHYRISAKLNPNDEEIHNNLANLYTQSNRPELAIQEFKIALQISPNNAVIHRNLGATYFVMKKYIDAYEHFKRAVELNPNFEKDLGEVIKQLKKVEEKAYDSEYSFSIG